MYRKARAQCLVLSPTRELCMQIQEEMSKYGDAYARP